MTHSKGKPLTFDDLCAEAFGAMGLHPWELWEYTMGEFLLKRKGHYDARRQQWQQEYLHIRLQTYYGIVYDPNLTLSVRRKKMDALVPDIYEPLPTEKDLEKEYEDKRAHAKRVTEKLKQRGKQSRHRR